jgi:hypothetical protein
MPLVKPACRGGGIQPQPPVTAFDAEAKGVVGAETEVFVIQGANEVCSLVSADIA